MSISIVGGTVTYLAGVDANLHRDDVPPESTPKDDAAARAAKEMGERIKALLAKKGWKYSHLDAALGHKTTGYTSRLVAGQKKRPDVAILKQIAVLLDTDLAHLTGSEGEAAANESTPHTPPVRSGARPRSLPDVIPEYVEDWFNEVLQDLRGAGPYKSEWIRPAKGLVAAVGFKLGPNGPRKIVLGALEAAKHLAESDQEITFDAIHTLWAEGWAPSSEPSPAPGERADRAAVEASQARIDREVKAMKRDGHVPPDRSRRGKL